MEKYSSQEEQKKALETQGQMEKRETNDYARTIKFINKLDGLKKVTRYKEYESFRESAADHSWKSTILASAIKNLPEIAKLRLDWERILKILLVHDLPELETKVGDVSAKIYSMQIMKF